jgi:hypothetical protein
MGAAQDDASSLAGPRPRTFVPDVVAGLLNDGSAYLVARAAAREAAQRGSRVRFVQVAAPGITPEERDDVDRYTFRAALCALKGRHCLDHARCDVLTVATG